MAREYTGRDMVKLVHFVARYHGMPRVGTALVSDYDIIIWSEKVDEFSFGFVSPLQADYTGRWHRIFPSKSWLEKS
jgi:hypothetical protein